MQAPIVEMQRKTQVNAEEMHRISCTCVSLRRRAPKPNEMGVPSKMHPRDKVRAHLPASQRKEGLGGAIWGWPTPRVARTQTGTRPGASWGGVAPTQP